MESKFKYKVSLYVCPANLPFVFATHPWFVIENSNTVARWEVAFQNIENNHLYKNFLPPFSGISIFPFSHKFFWKSSLVASIEGDENSLAHQMVQIIENSPNSYPYQKTYSLTGPNSNTYVQWVLNNFPEFKVKLPWNSFGKNYHG